MTTLKNITIDEVSLVDAGANPAADVVLVKRKDGREVDALKACRKLIQELTAQVDKFKEGEFLKLARRYEILGRKAEDLAPILKAVNAQNPELYKEVIAALDGALEATEYGKLFAEVGKRGDAFKPQGDIQKYAAAIRQQNPTFTFRQALDAAYLQHPELQ